MSLPLHCADCHNHAKCIDGKCVCQEGYDGNGNVCEGIYKIFALCSFVYTKNILKAACFHLNAVVTSHSF